VPIAAVVLFGGVEPEHGFPIQALALLLGAAAVLGRTFRGEGALPIPGLTLAVLALCALPALQLLPIPAGAGAWIAPGLRRFDALELEQISTFPHATQLALVRWLSYAAFLLAALEALRRPGVDRVILAAIAALGIAEALYGVGNLLNGNGMILWVDRDAPDSSATGTLVNRNHYASVLVLGLFALLARRWRAPRPHHVRDESGRTVAYLAGATAIGVAIVCSRSRGGITSLVVGLGLLAALLPKSSEGQRGRLVLAGLGLLILAYSTYLGLGAVAARFAATTTNAELVRLPLWLDSLDLALDFPILGAGAGTFETMLPPYRTRLVQQVVCEHAHQEYLQLVAETGVVGLGIASGAAVVFVQAIRARLRTARERARLAIVALAAGLAAVLVHALVDFPFRIPGVTYLFLLTAATALQLGASRSGPD